MVPTIKVPDTKGCIRVCVMRNPYHGSKYLCAALADHLILMEWVEPMHKFMEIRRVEHTALPSPLLTFEMLISPSETYPLVCLGVHRASSSSGDMDRNVHFNVVNLNSEQSKWYDKASKFGEDLEVVNVTQLEKDAVLVCYKNFVKVVSLKGRLKPSHRMTSRLKFDFTVEAVVCLRDSVLAFHKHGLQGRSFHNNSVTQEIYDPNCIYRLLGSDRTIVVESRPANDPMSESNIYVLTGH